MPSSAQGWREEFVQRDLASYPLLLGVAYVVEEILNLKHSVGEEEALEALRRDIRRHPGSIKDLESILVELLEGRIDCAAEIYAPEAVCDLLAKERALASLRVVRAGDALDFGDLEARAYRGGDADGALSYLVRGLGRAVYFAGDQHLDWPKLRVDAAAVMPLWLYERERESFEEALGRLDCDKMVLSHFDSLYHAPIVGEMERVYGRTLVVLREFSKPIRI